MSDDEHDDLDLDDLEEMHAAVREHLVATDLAGYPAAARETIAGLLAVTRYASDAMRRTALVLRRQPAMTEQAANALDKHAEALDALMPGLRAALDEDDDELSL
jgi:hypothetical protein